MKGLAALLSERQSKMPSEITIKLEKPIALRDRSITAIALRPPTFKELREIGALAERVNFEGGWAEHVHWDRVGELISSCITEPAGVSDWIGDVGLSDAFRLIAIITRFWTATLIAAASLRCIPGINPEENGAN